MPFGVLGAQSMVPGGVLALDPSGAVGRSSFSSLGPKAPLADPLSGVASSQGAGTGGSAITPGVVSSNLFWPGAPAVAGTGAPPFVVPGHGQGDRVPIAAEPGELVVPRALAPQVLALFPALARATAGGGYQQGGVVRGVDTLAADILAELRMPPPTPVGRRVPVPQLNDATSPYLQLDPYYLMRQREGIDLAPLERLTPREDDTLRELYRIDQMRLPPRPVLAGNVGGGR